MPSVFKCSLCDALKLSREEMDTHVKDDHKVPITRVSAYEEELEILPKKQESKIAKGLIDKGKSGIHELTSALKRAHERNQARQSSS